MPITTLVTAFYLVKSKFPPERYIGWMKNLLPHVTSFNLVVFCDSTTRPLLEAIAAAPNPRIRLVEKPMTDFYTYKYKANWIANQAVNTHLSQISWELNMLWAEKINFVKSALEADYFPGTSHIGWCDIGYFRDGPPRADWPNCAALNPDKIYYALVNNNRAYVADLMRLIINKNTATTLPTVPIPPNQISVAGGFFITAPPAVDWWHETFYSRLDTYFKHGALVKDDQIIVADCVFSQMNRFVLVKESEPGLDNWFLFRRYL